MELSFALPLCTPQPHEHPSHTYGVPAACSGAFLCVLSPLTLQVALLVTITSFHNNVCLCGQTILNAHTDLGNLKPQT